MKGVRNLSELETKYGIISGIVHADYYKNGQIRECMLNKENHIYILDQHLIPKYEIWELRDKYTNALSFYRTGELESIVPAIQTPIQTPLGIVPAELITFHKNGKIDRVFMLNGKLSAYWAEEDEYKLAKPLKIETGIGQISNKFINFCFYPSGNLKSFTLWKKEVVAVQTVHGTVNARIGVSFYENGALETLEPNSPTWVTTPIGKIQAYDLNALGIFGDANSLKFDQDGRISSLITSTNKIMVSDKKGQTHEFKPTLIESKIVLDGWIIAPIKIDFNNSHIAFHDSDGKKYEYQLEDIHCVIGKK